MKKNIDKEIAYTSMCIWEYISGIEGKGPEAAFNRKRDDIGTVEFRYMIIDVLAPAVNIGWDAIFNERNTWAKDDSGRLWQYDGPFDWEFVPSYLDALQSKIEEWGWSITKEQAESIAKGVIDEQNVN